MNIICKIYNLLWLISTYGCYVIFAMGFMRSGSAVEYFMSVLSLAMFFRLGVELINYAKYGIKTSINYILMVGVEYKEIEKEEIEKEEK